MVDPKVRVRSYPDRARYDIEFAAETLDAGLTGHLTTVRDGVPHVVPLMYVRVGEFVHLHCRRDTALAHDLASPQQVAFAVTVVDGIVLANAVRYHSLNYRSLVIHGSAEPVTDTEAKRESFGRLAEQLWPGRSGLLPASDTQLESVSLFALGLTTFSGKERQGPPLAGHDPAVPGVWTGHVDLETRPSQFHPTSADREAELPRWPF